MKQVTIYTDGACKGNPGPGAYGVVLLFGEHRKEVSAGYRLTTNNRMELLAAITALNLLQQPCKVELHSDSKYLVQAMNDRWIDGWQKKDWVNSKKEPVKNKDLWLQLLDAIGSHDITWKWVKGHAGNTENERCDELANEAVIADGLLEDEGFEA
ncbi:MAG: ribonuclease HI [Luteolibacter sp.]